MISISSVQSEPLRVPWCRVCAFSLLLTFCDNGRMRLIANDQPLQKKDTIQVKPFVNPPQNLNPNSVGPLPSWVTPTVIVALIVLCPLLVIIAVLLQYRMREWARSREILQIANQPARRASETCFAVVSPKSNITPDNRKAIAAALRNWLSHRSYSKQVHGLEQLEAGEHPLIPAPHTMTILKYLPHEKLANLHLDYWSVLLLEVNQSIDFKLAYQELEADLSDVLNFIGFITDPWSYDAWMM